MNEQNRAAVQGSDDTRRKLRRIPLIAAMSVVACVGVALALLLELAPKAAVSAPVDGARITIKLNGVAGSKGVVMAALCDKDTFLKRCPYMQSVAASPTASVEFTGVKPGTYAAMLYHDENGNGEFDRSANGMPLEGYGFSRNAKGNYGPPSFEAAAVEIKAGKATLDIDMVY